MTDVCSKDFHMGKKIVIKNLELAVQTNMMRRVVANSNLISLSHGQSTIKEESVPESDFHKDDTEQLAKFHQKTQLEELTHLASTLTSTCISYKAKQRFINYLKINPKTRSLILWQETFLVEI